MRFSRFFVGLAFSVSLLSAPNAFAAKRLFNVNGTVGSDSLTGTITYDSSIPANGLQAVYSAVDLKLSGPQTNVNGLIAGAFTTVQYAPPAALPPPYYVGSGTVFGVVNGYTNIIGLYVPSDPMLLGSTPFEVIANQQYISNGIAVSDHDIFGSASLTAVPEPAAWSLMIIGFGGIGAALRTRRRKSLSARILATSSSQLA